MKETTVERLTVATMFVLGFSLIAMILLIGWGFIEVILWLTSK